MKGGLDMQKRIDVEKIAGIVGTLYPPPFDLPCRARERRKIGDAAGLTQFGVNLLVLPPVCGPANATGIRNQMSSFMCCPAR
jgi:hypothetical protein